MLIEFLKIFGLIIGIIITIVFFLYSNSEWSVHKTMTKKYANTYSKATYNDFLYQFNKIDDWVENHGEIYSRSKAGNVRTRHNEVAFDNVHMLFTNFITFILVMFAFYKLKYKLAGENEIVKDWTKD